MNNSRCSLFAFCFGKLGMAMELGEVLPQIVPKLSLNVQGSPVRGRVVFYGVFWYGWLFFSCKIQHRAIYPCSMDGPKYTKFAYFLTTTPLFRKYTHRCFADLCTKVILMPATEKYFPGSQIDYFKSVKLILL